MTTSADQLVTARRSGPELLEQGTDQTLVLSLYRAGELLTPSAASLTLTNASGTDVIDAAASRLGGGTTSAEYDVADAVTSTETLGTGWLLTWVATLSGVQHTWRTEAMLVRCRLQPVVTEADLYRRQPALDPSSAGAITAATDYADHLDEAWSTIQERLTAAGNRPSLVLSPASLRQAHLALTLSYVYRGLATRDAQAYMPLADQYAREYEAAWRALRLVYDQGDSGTRGRPGERRGADASLWLGTRTPSRRWPGGL